MQAGDIPKREFGKTGELLTVIGPGGARFRMVSWEEATAIVRRCYDLGINNYDCSHNYWGGRSEDVYGAVLAPFRSDVFIRAAKVSGANLEDWKKPLGATAAGRQTPRHDDV